MANGPKELIPLMEHNIKALESWREFQHNGNGLACPSCGAELFDILKTGIEFVGDEAQNERFPGKLVFCSVCDFQGYRYM